MRTTVNLPDPLLRTARRRASERGVTLSHIVEDALRADLARDRSRIVPPFKLHTVHGRLVNPDLDLDSTSALLMLDDEQRFSADKVTEAHGGNAELQMQDVNVLACAHWTETPAHSRYAALDCCAGVSFSRRLNVAPWLLSHSSET